MKISKPLQCISLAFTFVFAPAISSHAETLLFEDEFELSDEAALAEPAGRQEINREAAKRQTGSLAPSEYSSTGQSWQQQLSGRGVVYGAALRIFPEKHRALFLSPGWSLEESAGDYAFTLRILPHQGDEEQPALVFVALGADSGILMEGSSNFLGGALVLKVSLLVEPSVVLMQDGVAISDTAYFPGMADGGELAIKWTQKGGREITVVEVLIDGASILKHDGNVTVVGGNVAFGAHVSADQIIPEGFGCLVIDSLRYTRE